MGRKTIVEYYDDMTGDSEGPIKPVTFGYDMVWYELDLNQEHLAQLEAALAPFQKKARPLLAVPKVTASPYKRRKHRQPKYSGVPSPTLAAIRLYVLVRHGVELRPFGRIAEKWIELWREAGSPSITQIRGEPEGQQQLEAEQEHL